MFELVGEKWTPAVICVLARRVHRYGEIATMLPGISKKVLTQTLRSLEKSGLVKRKVYPVVPPKTEYCLTDQGDQFYKPILAMAKWAKANAELLEKVKHRNEHDADPPVKRSG